MGRDSIILCISDTQEPFGHIDAIAFCQHVLKTYKKGLTNPLVRVVHQGDEVDQHTLSIKFIGDPNGRSGGDELKEAIHRLRDWYRAFPRVRVCNSNHTYRAWKKAKHIGLPQQFLKDVADVYEAPPGWKWGDEWVLESGGQQIKFEHGENVSGPTAALLAAMQNHMSTSIGHQHTHGGVIHSGFSGGVIWGMNTGCLIDVDAYAFAYGKTLRKKPTLGCGIIVNGVPHFVPMVLNKRKRWIGRLV